MIDTRLIAVMRGAGRTRVESVAAKLRRRGLEAVEVTMDSPDPLESIAALAGAGYTVGAGTVLTAADAERALEAGAAFIVSPATTPAVGEVCAAAQAAWIPGVLTPTEALHAWDLGAAAVKLFPASTVGTDHLRSMLGPLAHISFIATGGVDASNAAAFLQAGAVAVGVGGWLVGAPDDQIDGRLDQLLGAASV